MLTKTRVFFILIALSLVTSQAISPISGGGGGGGTPGGSTTQVQYNNAGTFDGITGATTNGTTLTLVAPILGTPASGVMTNVTGTAAGLTAGNVTTDANLTGVITSSGNATSIGSQTGTGTKFVVDTSPTLVTPNIGTPSAGVLTNATGLPISTGVSGLGASVATFLATPSGANLASALTSALPISKGGTALTAFGVGVGGNGGLLNTDVGTMNGAVLFNGALGTPSSGTLTNATGYTVAHISGFGVGVATALGFDTGTSNAFVVQSGALGTPSSGTLTAATGLPISTGVSGLGTGVATALGFNTGSANAFVVNGGVLGTPSSGTVTNLTGTASININGTVGATTPGTGAFTTLTNTGAATNSKSGAASTSALAMTGVPFAGTGTTSFPLVYINDANATASTTLSTSGTSLGVNAHTGIGNLQEWMLDGVSKAKITSAGDATLNSATIGAGQSWATTGRASIKSNNSANVQFGSALPMGVSFAGNTNSFPSIVADAVNDVTLQSAALTSTWNDASTANSGTVANRYLLGIAAPTLTSTGTSVTNTVASTVYIGGAPTDSTNTTSTTKYALNVAGGVINLAGPVVVSPGYTVATLPSTAVTGKVTGARAYVTDAIAPTFLGALTGGGSTVTPVFYNGTAWVSE